MSKVNETEYGEGCRDGAINVAKAAIAEAFSNISEVADADKLRDALEGEIHKHWHQLVKHLL